MALINQYLSYVEQYTSIYGEKTLVLMQVGSFFECYALINPAGEYTGSRIQDFSDINEMAISKKNVCVGGKSVVMAGFGLAQLEKYVKRLQEHGYTVVVFTQDTQTKNTTRSLSCIYSPGTFFSSETALDDDSQLSNNTTCIWIHYSPKNSAVREMITVGIANIDIYTGKSSLNEFSTEYYHNPTTYDELERSISIFNPTETILISNLPRDKIDGIINFANIQSRLVHIVDINANTNSNTNSDTQSKNELYREAINCERQIYQREILNKFFNGKGIADIDNGVLTNYFNYSIANQSYCFLLEFVYRHNPSLVKNIQAPYIENVSDRLILANHSLKQLNIIGDSRHTGRLSSVQSLLNNCITSMGRRRFNDALLNPITDSERLNRIYDITDHFLNADGGRALWHDTIRCRLTTIKDFEKIERKLVMRRISPKDFYNLYQNLSVLREIDEKMTQDNDFNEYIREISNNNNIFREASGVVRDFISEYFDIELCKTIDEIASDRLSNMVFIKRGISDKLDQKTKKSMDTREILEAIKNWMSGCVEEYEKSSKKTNTTTNSEYIKIHETPKSDPMLIGTKRRVVILKTVIDRILSSADNTKKQKISYTSRYSGTTEEYWLELDGLDFVAHGGNKTNMVVKSGQIDRLCGQIETAKDELVQELVTTYNTIIDRFSESIACNNVEDLLRVIINYTSECDLIQARCYIADKYNYCRPFIDKCDKSYVDFTKIRHPLIEQLNTNELYVTNDYCLGFKEHDNINSNNNPENVDGVLLYGTNAVGKTSFIKSIGIAIIMAQAGLFVACRTFRFSPYNYIFTRILGNDNIFKGLSTFAVEMSELRTILRMCDQNSLVLGDELCSGTESTSALSIFAAGVEQLHKIGASFIFATHFHEVANYEEIRALSRLRLCHMSVVFDRERRTLVYDRKLREGPGENMYGLEVCKALDLPYDFLDRAHELRIKYSANPETLVLRASTSRYNSDKLRGQCEICLERPSTEVHHLQFQKNADSRGIIRGEFSKNHKANLINICDVCHDRIHKQGIEHRVKLTTDGYQIMEL